MGHIIQWDNPEKTVILQQYTDTPHKDDLYQLARESADMLKSVDHTVHLIIDERSIDLTLTSTDMKYLEKLVPANQGAVVVVVKDSVFLYKNILLKLGRIIAPHAFGKTYFSREIEDARQLLQEKFKVVYPSTGDI